MSNPKAWFGDVEVIVDFHRGGPPKTRPALARVYIENDEIVCEERTKIDMFGQLHWERLRAPGEIGGPHLKPLLEALISQLIFWKDRRASDQSSPLNS